jgi:Core-2/I-Branching enzyme
MKIAFLVLNHRPPAQLVRLVTVLRSQLPDSPVVVHHDIFGAEPPGSLLEPIGGVHLLTSGKRAAWGDSSIVDIYCWSLAWMAEHLEFDWVILLSAQDYPIKPLSGLAEYLTRNGADALLHAVPVTRLADAAARRDMRRRYLYQYRPSADRRGNRAVGDLRRATRRRAGGLIDAVNFLQPCFKIYRLPDGMAYRAGWRARRTPFGAGRPCWHGSMWFSLSRKAADHVLEYLADHPEYREYYRHTIIADESMLATLLHNTRDLRVDDRDVHYTRWTHTESGHPDTFGVGDLAELLAVPEYFARKFDIGLDSLILDRLDEVIGGSDRMRVY